MASGHGSPREKATGEMGPRSELWNDFESLTLECRHKATKSGVLRLQFELLGQLEPVVRRIFWDCLVDKSLRSQSAGWASPVRDVLSTLLEQKQRTGWAPS